MQIITCPSCDGFAWFEDDFTGEVQDCDWCAGVGYIYRNEQGIDQKIPLQDLQNPEISAQLEALEIARMHEMGYTGAPKKPWEQTIRKGTSGGENPYQKAD